MGNLVVCRISIYQKHTKFPLLLFQTVHNSEWGCTLKNQHNADCIAPSRTIFFAFSIYPFPKHLTIVDNVRVLVLHRLPSDNQIKKENKKYFHFHFYCAIFFTDLFCLFNIPFPQTLNDRRQCACPRSS